MKRSIRGVGCRYLAPWVVLVATTACGDGSGDGGTGAEGPGGAGGVGGHAGGPAMGGDAGGAGHAATGGDAGGAGHAATGGSPAADAGGGTASEPPSISALSPDVVDPMGGSRIVLSGSNLDAATSVRVGSAPDLEIETARDGTKSFVSPPGLPVGPAEVLVTWAGGTLAAGTVEVWSPAEIEGARVFDAATGIEGEGEVHTYEWQRLTEEISPEWRSRDGLTVTWFPQTGKFWMVAGWNPFVQPSGFPTAEGIYPNETTTNEVWSSPDGVTWTQELEHLNAQFEPRHSHGTVVWKDKLWTIGGDTHLGHYNHDVLSSADGVNWEVTTPPWPPRAFEIMGVHNDRLWMFGGQEFMGPPEEVRFFNDVWSSADGITWEEVLPHVDASDPAVGVTRPPARSVTNNLVEFRGRMWLLSGGLYREWEPGAEYIADVWSTLDGVTWTKHAAPPWVGKHWPDVRVWDDKLWYMFGYHSSLGNSNEMWSSDDGEAWTQIAPDRNVQPGSHAQGVAVTDDFLLYAGGNGAWNNGAPPAVPQGKATWRFKKFVGTAVERWTERGAAGLVVTADGNARPVVDPNALGAGIPGVQFDGSANTLMLAEKELQEAGRSVFWVGRSPWMPETPGWDEAPPILSPLWTVVGAGPEDQSCAVGLGDGSLFYTSSTGGAWTSLDVGEGLQVGTGEVRFVGVTHAADGTVQGYIDGQPVGAPASHGYDVGHGWSRIGSNGYYETQYTAYAGSLGAVVITGSVLDAATVTKMHKWAQGRFGAP